MSHPLSFLRIDGKSAIFSAGIADVPVIGQDLVKFIPLCIGGVARTMNKEYTGMLRIVIKVAAT